DGERRGERVEGRGDVARLIHRHGAGRVGAGARARPAGEAGAGLRGRGQHDDRRVREGRVAGRRARDAVGLRDDGAAAGAGEAEPVPAQSPDQPANVEPAGVVAPSVTGVDEKSASQVAPQSMPVWFDATVPAPVPARVTVTWATPVPLSDAASEPPGDAVTVSEPGLAPTVDGSKRTVTWQCALGASACVQVVASRK